MITAEAQTMPKIQSVKTEDDYIYVRFRDPDQYERIQTLDWVKDPPNSFQRALQCGPVRRTTVMTGKSKAF